VTFQVGDKVIYPNHGLGVIERIEEKTILGTTCGFYSPGSPPMKRRCWSRSPTRTGSAFARRLTTRSVTRLFRLLGDGKFDSQQNWKGRFKDNSDRMRSGSIYDVAEVLKSLTFLSRSKSLSFREKRMLDRARFLSSRRCPRSSRSRSRQSESRVDKALIGRWRRGIARWPGRR
jgi:CarD family transcriptional regulator